MSQLDIYTGKVIPVRKQDRRMFILDTEADMANGAHVVTHISIAELEIDYEAGTHQIVRTFDYGYEDRVPSTDDIAAHNDKAILGLSPAMRRAFGGVGAFVIDMCAGLYQNSIMLAHNMSGYDGLHLVRLLTRQLDDIMGLQFDTDDSAPLNINFGNTIIKGTQLIEVPLPKLNICLRDTKLILPGSLANLARSFKLPGEKGIFPYSMPQIEPWALGAPVRALPIYYWPSGLPPLSYYLSAEDDDKKVGYRRP